MVGLSALVLILAEGGLTTSWAHARAAAPVAMVLATVGVVVSIVVVAVLTRFLLNMGWRESLLLGAVLAPTDAAAVFSVLRRLPLPSRLSGILEGESGLNDPPAVLAVTLLSDVGHHAPSPGLIAGEIVYELAAGAAIGILAGVLGALALRRIALPASGLYPIAILALIVASYGAATLAHASGFLAVYVSALVLGNARLPHGPAIRGFAEGVAWLAQIGLFVMLGLLASPVRLPAQIIPALVVGGVLALLARPAAVLVCTLLMRVSWRQQAFLSWAGLRGAVPIVLATIPMNARVPGATRVFDVVFIIVVINTLIQGPTLPWVARQLKVTAPAEPLEVDVEAAPLEDLQADLLQLQIPPESRLHGVEIFELRLPPQASVALIVRDGQGFVPGSTTALRAGDRLLIVAADTVREAAERRLRAVSRAGRLAGWLGEHGSDSDSGAGAERRERPEAGPSRPGRAEPGGPGRYNWAGGPDARGSRSQRGRAAEPGARRGPDRPAAGRGAGPGPAADPDHRADRDLPQGPADRGGQAQPSGSSDHLRPGTARPAAPAAARRAVRRPRPGR